MRVMEIRQTGGPEVLEASERPTPEPGPSQVRVRHEAIGLNMIDTYYRTGLYPAPLPLVLGVEAAGVVDSLGSDVADIRIGDRVGYVGQIGTYAEFGLAPAARLVPLSAAITFEQAAASMLKGMTAEFLAERIVPLEREAPVLVYAAAGGVGAILTQWLARNGARVIAVVGTNEKAHAAGEHGAAAVILHDQEDISSRVRELTLGAGVRVAYDSVGRATFESTLKSIGRRGVFVSYGNASGPVPAFEPLRLSRAGSLLFTRPTLFDYIATPEELLASSGALFDRIASGTVKVDIGQRFALADAEAAHRALEARQTTGSTILMP